MSLITRCPACETMFKVVPDQLRISEGWVRCGQCGEVFDASRHLLPDPNDEAAAATEASPPPAAPAPAAPSAPLVIPLAPYSESLWTEPVAPPQTTPPEEPVAPRREPPVASDPLSSEQMEHQELPDVSFMRDGKAKTVWQRPAVRVALLLLVLLLLAALAAQFLLRERDRIATMEPSTRPVLLALCSWARCSLGPLHQIEAIAIESSSFTLVRGDNYKLAFSLKNNAPLNLAMPAIELSLTDGQDQALIRRVILPAEFGASSTPLAAGSDWSASLALSVKTATNTDRVAGYRLLAFYP